MEGPETLRSFTTLRESPDSTIVGNLHTFDARRQDVLGRAIVSGPHLERTT
jgi:hypothetical protein